MQRRPAAKHGCPATSQLSLDDPQIIVKPRIVVIAANTGKSELRLRFVPLVLTRMYRKFKPPFFWPQQYRRAWELSIPLCRSQYTAGLNPFVGVRLAAMILSLPPDFKGHSRVRGFDADPKNYQTKPIFIYQCDSRSFLISFPVVPGKDFAISLNIRSNLWLSWQLV